jgi:hypothetical protein
MIQMAPVIVENQRLLQAAFAIRHSQRFGQQYGTLLAGWAAAITDGRLTADEVTALVDQVRLEQEISSNQTPDQEECLQHLRYSQYRLGDHTVSVSELLHAQDAQKLDWEALENQAWKDHPVWKTLKPQLAKLGILVSVPEGSWPGVRGDGQPPGAAKAVQGHPVEPQLGAGARACSRCNPEHSSQGYGVGTGPRYLGTCVTNRWHTGSN